MAPTSRLVRAAYTKVRSNATDKQAGMVRVKSGAGSNLAVPTEPHTRCSMLLPARAGCESFWGMQRITCFKVQLSATLLAVAGTSRVPSRTPRDLERVGLQWGLVHP